MHLRLLSSHTCVCAQRNTTVLHEKVSIDRVAPGAQQRFQQDIALYDTAQA